MATVGTVLVSGGGVYPHLSAGTRTIKINCSALLSDTECGAVVDALKANMPAGSKRIDLTMPPAILAQLASCEGWLDVALRLRYVLVIAPRAVDYDMTANVLRCAGAVAPVELEVDLIALMQNRINEVSRLFAVAHGKIPLLLFMSFNSAFVHFAYDVVKTRAVEANVRVFDTALFTDRGLCTATADEGHDVQVSATFSWKGKNNVTKTWSFNSKAVQIPEDIGIFSEQTKKGNLDLVTKTDAWRVKAIMDLKTLAETCPGLDTLAAIEMTVTVGGEPYVFYTDRNQFQYLETHWLNGTKQWYLYSTKKQLVVGEFVYPIGSPIQDNRTLKMHAIFAEGKAKGLYLSGEVLEAIKTKGGDDPEVATFFMNITRNEQDTLQFILCQEYTISGKLATVQTPKIVEFIDGKAQGGYSSMEKFEAYVGKDYKKVFGVAAAFMPRKVRPTRSDFVVYDDDDFAAMPSRPAKTIRAGAA